MGIEKELTDFFRESCNTRIMISISPRAEGIGRSRATIYNPYIHISKDEKNINIHNEDFSVVFDIDLRNCKKISLSEAGSKILGNHRRDFDLIFEEVIVYISNKGNKE